MKTSGGIGPRVGVVPAGEHLEGRDPAVGQRDDRLEHGRDLLARDGAQQLVAELELAHRVGLHARLEDAQPAALGRLGAVHRGVGVAQQALRLAAAGGEADARAHAQLVAIDPERRREGLDDARAEDLGRCRVCLVRDEDREFVAAEPRRGVGSAQALADALGRLDQQPVAGQVAEAVVDELELVDVEEEHGDLAVRRARLARARDRGDRRRARGSAVP